MKLASSKVHFIGIGGIGMCGLAELLHNMGAQVTGSDLSDNIQTQRLQQLGIQIFKGHRADHLVDAEVVVFSSAVQEDNQEYQEARRRKIPLIRRAEALAEIMRLKRGIAVAGTHGKTTTTSLTASIFLSAQYDPTIVVGGRLDVIKSTAQLGKGEWLIAEADESDGSFNRLFAEIVIITNIDNDHLDHYGSFEVLEKAFLEFASRIPFYGTLIVCGDSPHVRKLFQEFPKKIIFYGQEASNDVVVKKDGTRCRLLQDGKLWTEFNLPLPGVHNALNATAAILAAHAAGISLEEASRSVALFRGVDRRFQQKAKIRGIDFFDDYGHHPTEVAAVLSALKERFPDRRKVVLFQPHRYSRTQICWQQFLTCFKDADYLRILDIYAAGEKEIKNINSEKLAAQVEHPDCKYLSRQLDPALEQFEQELKTGDVVLTLGAGDVYKLGEKMMDRMAKQNG